MNKTFCDRCKKDISNLKVYEMVSLGIKDLKQYALNDEKGIKYNKTICPECAIDLMNIIDIECDEYILKTCVERSENSK